MRVLPEFRKLLALAIILKLPLIQKWGKKIPNGVMARQ